MMYMEIVEDLHAEVERWRAEAERWRHNACDLQDELQLLRDSLSDDALMACPGANKMRVRVEVTDPKDKRETMFVVVGAGAGEASDESAAGRAEGEAEGGVAPSYAAAAARASHCTSRRRCRRFRRPPSCKPPARRRGADRVSRLV